MEKSTSQFLGEEIYRTSNNAYACMGGGSGGDDGEGQHRHEQQHQQLQQDEDGCWLGCSSDKYDSKLLSVNKFHQRKTANKDDVLLMTEGFDKLSVEEREQALAHLHGVADAIQETAELIDQSLNELETAISKIKQKRSAYDKAMFLSPRYVKNRDFRLMFLRCERFDVQKAASRMVKHFEMKLELFGLHCLGRNITFDDLDDDSKAMYMTGFHWMTDDYDRSGRRMFLITGERAEFKKAINYLRMLWYIIMVALEDTKTQMNGSIVIVFAKGTSIRKPFDLQSIMQSPRVTASTPFFWGAVHFCYEDKVAAQVYPNPITIAQVTVDVLSRMRFRAHHGSVVEMKYALLGYGIPVDVLPLDNAGYVIHERFENQVSLRRKVEEERNEILAASNVIDCPTQYDVLLGRGKPYQGFPGNVRLNQLVELQNTAYEEMNKTGKTAIVLEIVHAIHKLGGRFLRKTNAATNAATNATTSTTAATKTSAAATSDRKDNQNDNKDNDDNTNIKNVQQEQQQPQQNHIHDGFGSWEEVDFTLAHRKVGNCFQTRKRLSNNNSFNVSSANTAAFGGGGGRNGLSWG